MGWRSHDDDGDESGRGLSGGGGEGAQCATRRVVQSRCHTEEVEPGRFVRKCEKTEQLLRDCIGRYVSLNPFCLPLAILGCDWYPRTVRIDLHELGTGLGDTGIRGTIDFVKKAKFCAGAR